MLPLLGLFYVVALGHTCDLRPENHLISGPKRPGDNFYKILVGGNIERYVPGQNYLVALLGSRTHTKLQQFTRFKLTAEPLDSAVERTPLKQGHFQLYPDSMTSFYDKCINSVVEADDLPKTEINVQWTAPKSGSGCVQLKAMVYENENSWFAEDGQLTKVLCEDRSEPKEDCCACDEAKYTMVFEGIWSKETHPKDFPKQTWLIHFSDVIGATHGKTFSFWGEGKIASDGFRSLAEWGSIQLMERELRQHGTKLRSLVKASGLWYPNVNSNTSTVFHVDRKRHFLSAASMFGPSPDWVVGVNGLDLCRKDCTWEEEKIIDLYPYDAGTDNGITYVSPNSPTMPRERIYRITTMYPEDPRAPFYNPGVKEIPPLARMYLKRDKLIPRSCDTDVLEQLVLDVAENSQSADRAECGVTEWSSWSACSVSCGKGLRMRSRQYQRPDKAIMFECDRQLISKEMCVAALEECPEDNAKPDSPSDLDEIEEVGSSVCATSEWGEWSPCSVSCGIGVKTRSRYFIDKSGKKKCPLVTTHESEKCMLPECQPEVTEAVDPLCPVTDWSSWSPCSVSCGPGHTVRMRLLLVADDKKELCSKHVQLMQHQSCSVKKECSVDMQTAKQICMEEADPGICRGSFDRWTFVAMKGMCIQFPYSGCSGNRNNFLTQEECLNTCQVVIDALGLATSGSSPQIQAPVLINETSKAIPRAHENDCLVSEWSDWSTCNLKTGYQQKNRTILEQPKQGGAKCPKRLLRRRRCFRI